MGSYALPVRSAQTVRTGVVCTASLLSVLLFGSTLRAVLNLAIHDDRYLQIAVGPLACLFLLYWQRVRIFARAAYSPHSGMPLLSLAALLGGFFTFYKPGGESSLLLSTLAMIFLWVAAFVFCCGPATLRASLYPVSCLFLMLPVPISWIDRLATGLQHGSADVSFALLKLAGIPVLRTGMIFSLPGLNFEVAPECSGIHSALALGLIAIVFGYLCLRTAWARFILIFLTLPIAVFKNAVRIVVLSTLGAYVDRIFITGPIHHKYGGVLFSAVAVALFAPLLAGLQKIESRLSLGGRGPESHERTR